MSRSLTLVLLLALMVGMIQLVMGLAKILLPEKVRHTVRDRLFPLLYRSSRDDGLKPDEKSRVYERFAGDSEKLKSILEIDLGPWRSNP